VAWLEKIETGSILIKEKRKHLSKMSDRVSRNVFRMEMLEVRVEKVSYKYISIIEVYSLLYTSKI
jgi:hypothetical protein